MADYLEHLGAALADRYTIEGEIGSGGMATVYLAEDLRHERNRKTIETTGSWGH